uniref:DNA-directed DNA polymerase n=1 Tax=Phanerochaete carnosa TaxID=231932 RepID=A0A895KWH4_9APHY|nr:DNA polymerase type B [Phanerochaete carnosa]QRZ60392.1 DNA polymerase type B [Phanerochaete carnosa]
MKTYPMPVGNPKFFEGNILEVMNRPYGFFEVEVTTPKDLFYPIIQTRINTSEGYRTVAPLGTWTTVLSSTEMYNAIDNFGYSFKINRGFLFERDIIYDKYVDHFNNIKSNTPKDNPMYLISKLLMNGLFGKTGQDYRFNETRLISNDNLLLLIQNKDIEVISNTEIGIDLNFVVYFDKAKYKINSASPRSFNGCIAHASEITSAARVEMSLVIKYLIENNYTIYYMDTDSFFINKPLPDHLVSHNILGKYKLENIYKEAIFLAPKVYAGITQDGNEVIKIKGLSHDTINKDVTFDLLKSLLIKNKSLTFNQTKTFRNIAMGSINLLEQTYNLIPTENKRELVFDDNNVFISTKPFVINKDKVIANSDP